MTLIYYYYIFVFIVGVCIGSFLNVVISRSFTGESIVLPPSKCPYCNKLIRFYDNVPILSYLILRGKCRDCKEKISVQYPIVELITGLSFLAISMTFGFSFTAFFLLILVSLAIVIAVTDIKEKVVFDAHTISFIVIALLFNLINKQIVTSLIGLLLGALVMETIARLGYLFAKKRAFGEGDTFIAAGIGALVGPKPFFLVLMLSVFFQVLLIFPGFIKKMWQNKEKNLVISLILFILITIIYKSLMYVNMLNVYAQSIGALLIVVSGGFACTKLTKITKTSTELTYLPFGPSLLIMTFVVVFYGEAIMKFLTKLM